MASLLSRASARGIGLSKLISTGNEADLEVSDCIEYFARDNTTSVIALYLETLRNPQRFLVAAQHAREAGKEIVCYKVGRSEAGARAATSHTGALAGSDRIFDALFAQAGVHRVSRFAELLAISGALATHKTAPGRRVGVLTTTGGAGTLIADACGASGLSLPAPGEHLREQIKQILPNADHGLSHNPIDLTLAGGRPEVMGPIISCLAMSRDFDALIVVIGSTGVAQPRLVADPLIEIATRVGVPPIFAYVSPHIPEVLQRLNRNGVPAFDAPEDCVAALSVLCIGSPAADDDQSSSTDQTPPSGYLLNEANAKDMFATFGIASPRRSVARTVEDIDLAASDLHEPLVLKLLAGELNHKSDVGGVVLGLTHSQLAQSARDMVFKITEHLPELEIEGFLLEEMHRGLEMLLGMTRDPLLGAAIVLGSGGINTELIADTVLSLVPVDLADARAMIDRLKARPMLSGARGQIVADIEALASAIVRFSEFVVHFGDRLIEAEINPLVVLEKDHGVLALDGLVRLEGAVP